MAFEDYIPKRSVIHDDLRLSISPDSLLYFPIPLATAIAERIPGCRLGVEGAGLGVRLKYDPDTQTIGMVPANPDTDPQATPIRCYRRRTTVSYTISCRAFLRRFHVSHQRATTYVVRWNGELGMFTANVSRSFLPENGASCQQPNRQIIPDHDRAFPSDSSSAV
jgi:hypothetical protein